MDESKLVKDAEKAEQKLSDQGRTATKFQLNPLAADLVINDQVKVDSNGKPIADIQVVDPKTGKVVDHIVVAGDPGGILDLVPSFATSAQESAQGNASQDPSRSPSRSHAHRGECLLVRSFTASSCASCSTAASARGESTNRSIPTRTREP